MFFNRRRVAQAFQFSHLSIGFQHANCVDESRMRSAIPDAWGIRAAT